MFLFYLVFIHVSVVKALVLDGSPNTECPELEQQLVDSLQTIKFLREEIKLLQQMTCRCHNGWIHGNGSCYYMPNEKHSWTDARSVCQSLGAHLAVVTTPEEDAIVRDIIYKAKNTSIAYEGVTYVWLGGFDTVTEGHWHWVTGEPFNYTNWRIPNPNDPNPNENCLDWSFGGWNDQSCSQSNYFLCEM